MARHNKHTAIAHEALPSVAGGRRGEPGNPAQRGSPCCHLPSLPHPCSTRPGCRAVYFVQTSVWPYRRRFDINILWIKTNALSLWETSISSILIRYLLFMCHYVFSSHLLTVILINQSVNLIKAKLQSQCLVSSTESNKRENWNCRGSWRWRQYIVCSHTHKIFLLSSPGQRAEHLWHLGIMTPVATWPGQSTGQGHFYDTTIPIAYWHILHHTSWFGKIVPVYTICHSVLI